MIHWKYIKGAYDTKFAGEANNPKLTTYTFLQFCGDLSAVTGDQNRDPIFSAVPRIFICNTVDGSGYGYDAGAIITQKATGQSISNAFTFNNTLTVANNFIAQRTIKAYGDIEGYSGENSWYKIRNISETNDYTNFHAIRNFALTGEGSWFNVELTTSQSLQLLARSDSALSPIANITYNGVTIVPTLTINNACHATYFNATSDRRAKTDLKPLDQSVLPLVMNTPLYSFKYKDLDTPSIGIIAQDVEDVDFNGFSLVDNKEASGLDMDYMSIHESKLVYILWKAVQEQQKEIEELKRQLKKD